MYTVKLYHKCKVYRKGDLEAELKLIDCQNFKTRKAAKEFIEQGLKHKKDVFRNYHKGDTTSYCGYYTGESWVHENTGETIKEFYQYIMTRTSLR